MGSRKVLVFQIRQCLNEQSTDVNVRRFIGNTSARVFVNSEFLLFGA